MSMVKSKKEYGKQKNKYCLKKVVKVMHEFKEGELHADKSSSTVKI